MNELQVNTIESYNQTAQRFSETIGKLSNYNHTYDALVEILNNGDSVLDLACGPAQISKYISDKKQVKITGVDLSDSMLKIAKETIPTGMFYKNSIIDFSSKTKFHAVIIGFGIPYLDSAQAETCISNAVNNLIDGQYLYISFMNGNGSRIEKTSFGGNFQFNIFYHKKEKIIEVFMKNNLKIIKEFELDYKEPDGSTTKDIILIAQKSES